MSQGAGKSLPLDSPNTSNNHHPLWPNHGTDGDLITAIGQGSHAFWSGLVAVATQRNTSRSRLSSNYRHRDSDTINIDQPGDIHLCLIGPIGIGIYYHAVTTIWPDVQFPDDIITHHTVLIFTIEEHSKAVPMTHSKTCWRGPWRSETSASDEISNSREVWNTGESDCHCCCWGPCSIVYVVWNVALSAFASRQKVTSVVSLSQRARISSMSR